MTWDFTTPCGIDSRFEKEFGAANRLFFIGEQPFVTLNSMALTKNCKCALCTSTQDDLLALRTAITSSTTRRPILLLHFPLFRPTEALCTYSDMTAALAEKEHKRNEFDDVTGIYSHNNKEDEDVVNAETTRYILSLFNPLHIFSGHTHYNCHYTHTFNNTAITETTVSTFNWRHRTDPSFVLATITNNNNNDNSSNNNSNNSPNGKSGVEVRIAVCPLPDERLIFAMYALGAIAWAALLIAWLLGRCSQTSSTAALLGRARFSKKKTS
eukprot:TRINITY_DN5074_c2_g2_i1.p1 TRINITY_DN5074_c2_g2~~TRINITY_DN5074_c2_g2_i1.p1  ORF type:complete len:269 (-),score=53.54 TRINITY_DN5074_c2_g2_i1:324-1130(-)